MTKLVILAMLAMVALNGVFADVYLHNPRGSNNRLNERSANRNNGNRLFDSQNNNRGGYNKGDKTNAAAGNNENSQYNFMYYMSEEGYLEDQSKGRSQLSIEWTNQHGCGGNEHDDPHKLNCQLVLQYQCELNYVSSSGSTRYQELDKTRDTCDFECFEPVPGNPTCDPNTVPACPRRNILHRDDCATELGWLWLPSQVDDEHNCLKDGDNTWEENLLPKDGTSTTRSQFTTTNNQQETMAARAARKTGDIAANSGAASRGMHEPWEWYDECYRRERNRGLFTADQNLRNNAMGYSSAVFTRQNPNNNRRGYECPEERDYYPYWHPTPWVDIAILTDRLDMCEFYQTESFNVKSKGLCRNTKDKTNCARYNNEATCSANQCRWATVGAHNRPKPECLIAPWSRVNHLGNGRHGQPNTYNWTLPLLTDGKGVAREHRCAFRLRYNISTDDYDAYRVNSSFNNNNGQGIRSPVRQNPEVDIGANNQALRLAINTAQFGRTFQDRSHAFRLVPRPSTPMFAGRNLYNINVRGKRGNIVQTFPSVEYDFVPNQLHASEDDLIHFQWAGSNTHNNGNPAGDGQAGDAGEGTGGTDRHNVVELKRRNFAHSFPNTWEENTMFTNMLEAFSPDEDVQNIDAKRTEDQRKLDWALRMATVGYYTSFDGDEATSYMDPDTRQVRNAGNKINNLLNNADASYEGGVFRFRRGSYSYMCTRNHNFSNRDQKGVLTVERTAANAI